MAHLRNGNDAAQGTDSGVVNGAAAQVVGRLASALARPWRWGTYGRPRLGALAGAVLTLRKAGGLEARQRYSMPPFLYQCPNT
jgi:hypothetical protein